VVDIRSPVPGDSLGRILAAAGCRDNGLRRLERSQAYALECP